MFCAIIIMVYNNVESQQKMALKYKINILDALKDKGYSSYTLRKEKLLSESTIQKLRAGEGVAWDNLETLCKLLDCDISELLEYQKEG